MRTESSAEVFDIIVDGSLLPGHRRADVISAIARRFRISTPVVEELFSGGRQVVKRGVGVKQSKTYIAALSGCGAVARAVKPADDASPDTASPEPPDFFHWLRGQPTGGSLANAEEDVPIFQSAAGGSLLTASVVDAVLWEEESSGTGGLRLQQMRQVGQAMLEFQRVHATAWTRPARDLQPAPAVSQSEVGGPVADLYAGFASSQTPVAQPASPAPTGGRIVLAGTSVGETVSSDPAGPPSVEDLRRYIRRQVQCSIAPIRLSPRATDSCVVSELSVLGPAAEYGVRQGDLLVSVDGEPASKGRTHFQRCVVHSRTHGEMTFTAADDYTDLGIRTKDTTVSLKRHYNGCFTTLQKLCDRGEFVLVKELAESSHASRRGVKYSESPVFLYWAIARFELGDTKRAIKDIERWGQEHAPNNTTDIQADCLYCLGRHRNALGDDGLPLLIEAYHQDRKPKIIDEIQRLTGERLPERVSPWVGRRFPLSYSLGGWGTRTTTSLDYTLQQMEPQQLLLVCVLGSFRANGPYSTWMRTYAYLCHRFSDFLFDQHIISAAADYYGADWWYEGEEIAAENDARFQVLYDPNESIASTLGIRLTPTVLAVDHRGVVRSGYVRDDVDMWNALAELAASVEGSA